MRVFTILPPLALLHVACALLAAASLSTGCNAFDDPSESDGDSGGFGFPPGNSGSAMAGGGFPVGGGTAGSSTMMRPPMGFCGNGSVEPGEQCDGRAGLEQVTCEKLGLGAGAVTCDAFCRLSTIECSGGMPECPADPAGADGSLCFEVEQSCSYPPACGGAECTCLPDDADGEDAGVDAEEDAGSAVDEPALRWRCAVRAC